MSKQTLPYDKKARAGQGEIVTVKFSDIDGREQRALCAAQHLACVPGRRKEYIVTFLSALWELIKDEELPDPVDVANAIRQLKG